jgi:hypothetical protein
MKHYADEDEMRDDLRETLDKEWQAGYDKGAADERAQIIEWLRNPLPENASMFQEFLSAIIDAIEQGAHEK